MSTLYCQIVFFSELFTNTLGLTALRRLGPSGSRRSKRPITVHLTASLKLLKKSLHVISKIICHLLKSLQCNFLFSDTKLM